MQVIRTAQQLTKSDWWNGLRPILKDNFTWYKVEEDEMSSSCKFYLDENRYIDYVNADDAKKIILYDTKFNRDLTISNIGATYHNATVFKVNDKCAGIAMGSDGTRVPAYSNKITFAFDTINNEAALAVISNITMEYCWINDSIVDPTGSTNIPFSYKNSAFVTAQIVPFVNCFSGAVFDNICAIVTTPYSECFVDFNNEKFLFTNNFAMACGNEIEYITQIKQEG